MFKFVNNLLPPLFGDVFSLSREDKIKVAAEPVTAMGFFSYTSTIKVNDQIYPKGQARYPFDYEYFGIEY